MTDGIICLDGARKSDQRVAALGGGIFVAYTCPSPDKESENEDTVAVFPYGPQAAVLIVADGAGGLPAGKRASLAAVRTLVDSLHSAIAEMMLLRTAWTRTRTASVTPVISTTTMTE